MAYEPSWTAMIGNPSQNRLPRHLATAMGVTFDIQPDGSIVSTYPIQAMSTWNRDVFPAQEIPGVWSTITKTVRYPTGSKSLSFYSPVFGSYGRYFGDEGGYGNLSAVIVTLTPTISALGALIGYQYDLTVTGNDDHWWGGYSNPTLQPFSNTETAEYFCDPTNGCGWRYVGQAKWSN